MITESLSIARPQYDICAPCLIAGLGNAHFLWQLAYSELDRNYSHSKAMNFNQLSCPLSRLALHQTVIRLTKTFHDRAEVHVDLINQFF